MHSDTQFKKGTTDVKRGATTELTYPPHQVPTYTDQIPRTLMECTHLKLVFAQLDCYTFLRPARGEMRPRDQDQPGQQLRSCTQTKQTN